MSTKRAIIIVFVLVVIGIVAYLVLRGGSSPSTTSQTGQTGSLPGVATSTAVVPSFFSTGAAAPSGTPIGSVSVVASVPVAAYFVNASSAVTVVQTDGEIVALAGGQTTALSSSSINNLVGAGFSYDGKKAVVSSGNAASPQVNIFDVASSSWTSLGTGITSPVWGPSGERLAYLRDNGNGGEAVIVTDFSKAKPSTINLGTFALQDMQLAWVDGNDLALVSRPSIYANGSALMVNIASKTLAPIVVGRPGLEAIWDQATSTPMGLMFSGDQSERGGHLQLVSTQGATLQTLSFLTLPTKCVFATQMIASSTATISASSTVATSTTITTSSSSSPLSAIRYPLTSLFCAVPRDQTTLSYYDLPDAYEQRQIFTSDDLYRVNLTTGHVDTLFDDQTQNFDMTDVSVVGPSAFFVNRYDEKLYAVKIQ